MKYSASLLHATGEEGLSQLSHLLKVLRWGGERKDISHTQDITWQMREMRPALVLSHPEGKLAEVHSNRDSSFVLHSEVWDQNFLEFCNWLGVGPVLPSNVASQGQS